MDTKIDWLSFSFPVGNNYPELGWRIDDVRGFLRDYVGDRLFNFLTNEEWLQGRGRAPYAHSIRMNGGHITIYWSGRFNHALLEITAHGMAWLRENDIERDMLIVAAERVTRIDIASDILTTTTPAQFVKERTRSTQHAHASVTSKTGDTEYVGGRTSEKFARVYRYAEPHPRARWLRVEHEIKKNAAKSVVAEVLARGVHSVQASLGMAFGWGHADWQPDERDASKITTPTNDRSAAKTELWLRTQAASAFKKLVEKGIIEHPEDWLKEVFLEQLHPNVQGGSE